MRREIVRVPHDDSGVSVLGRLLWVGVVAGLVMGGLAGAVLFAGGDFSYAVGGFSIGAMVGIVAGVAVQILNAVALHTARKARPELARAATRRLLLPLPPAAAALLPWLFSASGPGWIAFTAAQWATVLVVGVLSAGAAWVFAPWCLEPITPRREVTANR
jgi:drug/metabolite transporter (DMT)-like permease